MPSEPSNPGRPPAVFVREEKASYLSACREERASDPVARTPGAAIIVEAESRREQRLSGKQIAAGSSGQGAAGSLQEQWGNAAAADRPVHRNSGQQGSRAPRGL